MEAAEDMIEIEKVETAQPSDKQKNLQLRVDKGLIEMFLNTYETP